MLSWTFVSDVAYDPCVVAGVFDVRPKLRAECGEEGVEVLASLRVEIRIGEAIVDALKAGNINYTVRVGGSGLNGAF